MDIDVIYVPHRQTRPDALAKIGLELATVQHRLRARGLDAAIVSSRTGDETKLFVRRGRLEVKIEINHVFRGTMLPVVSRSLVPMAREQFTAALTVPTLAVPELYGSKFVAALDRQHPRDFFDVHGLYRQSGLRSEMVECFVGYLAGHNRPVHEVLFSRDHDMPQAYENEFEGMAREPVTLADLLSTRARLRRDLLTALTDAHRNFLLSLVAAEPRWELMTCPHLAELPAVQWKLQNLSRLRQTNPTKFRLQAEELHRRFAP